MIFNNTQINRDLALLILRLAGGGLMLYAHGWPKLANFTERWDTFANPLGLGSPISLILVVFAEVVCAAMLILGIFTRFASLVLIINMTVITFIVHASDAFGKKELPLFFLLVYLVVFLAGSGKYALKK
jgi:putative oxidoreductase